MAGDMHVGEGHVWWGRTWQGGHAWQGAVRGRRACMAGGMHAGRREWQERQPLQRSSSFMAVLMLTLGTTYLSKFNTWRCVSLFILILCYSNRVFP